ncbi:hypothetical protein [Niastella vici]|uniref:hypothetical protein n=1 Tax=Niastella vici TaxID=1703345 RepID=UPI001181076D|nr:hypothetical protein [Niastella vici]
MNKAIAVIFIIVPAIGSFAFVAEPAAPHKGQPDQNQILCCSPSNKKYCREVILKNNLSYH